MGGLSGNVYRVSEPVGCRGRAGCAKPVRCMGMCNACYEYNRKHGTTDRPTRRTKTDQEKRFWKQVVFAEACWLWTGAPSRRGYGRFLLDSGVRTLAHRAAWLILKGTIPSGLEVDHLCRVKLCVNPDHLELVTGKVNRERAIAAATKCRNGHPKSGRGMCPICTKERFKRFYEKHGRS